MNISASTQVRSGLNAGGGRSGPKNNIAAYLNAPNP